MLSLILISCTSNDKDELENDQSFYENNELLDFELFNLANEYILYGELDLALVELDKIGVLFPSSAYARKSMLVTAYINFLKEDYEKTRAISENYKKYYPGSKDIVYAKYLDAMTYYILIKKENYSQKNSYISKDKFKFILNAYPNSAYEIDIMTKINLIDNKIALNKLSTAKYYLDKDNINGSLVYLKEIYEDYSSSVVIEETLYYLSKIYFELEELELSKYYASILAYNYPKSKWYTKSYNLINDLIEEEEDNWIEKFNPIKIFKQEKVDNSKNTTIQPIE